MSFNNISENKIALALCTIFFAIGCLVIVNFDGTGDTGDSITHYLYARYAFAHPANFFSHWAKPFFTLMASPFAQFGFNGIKFFNLINATLTLWLVYKIALKLNLKNPLVALLILATCSSYFTLTFSGLTEHFHAFLLCLAIYLILTEGGLWACIVVSFLPFIRSEGLLMVGVFSLYFLIKRQWKYIPLLSIGHIFYGIVGRYYNGSFWWIFTKMTYATTNAYGSGSILHFFDRLYYMTGLPNFILWVIGVLSFLFLIKKKVNTPQFSVHFLLVYGSFWALFIAHTLFWYFGIFMSYGLGRVLNAVMPMFAIIALDGFNFILYFIKNINIRIWISRALVAYLLFFPFTKHPAAINASTSLRLEADQKTAIEIARFIKEKYPDYVVYVLHPQVMHSLGYDNFDRTKVMDIREALNAPLSKKSLIVWDSRFCIIDAGVVVEDVIKVPQLIEIQRFKTANNFEFVLYINSIQ